jgi:hypothetical protein
MKKITIIKSDFRKKAIDKSIELVKDRKHVVFSHIFLNNLTRIEKDTEVIIFDHINQEELVSLEGFLDLETILIRKPYEKAVEIERPEVIIFTNALDKKYFSIFENVEIIEL